MVDLETLRDIDHFAQDELWKQVEGTDLISIGDHIMVSSIGISWKLHNCCASYGINDVGGASVMSSCIPSILYMKKPHVGSRSCGFFVRIGPIRFLAGCHKRRLNKG